MHDVSAPGVAVETVGVVKLAQLRVEGLFVSGLGFVKVEDQGSAVFEELTGHLAELGLVGVFLLAFKKVGLSQIKRMSLACVFEALLKGG